MSHRLTAVTGAIFLLPETTAVAQAVAQSPETVPAGGFDITSAASMIIGLLFLLIVIAMVVFVRRRLEEQRVRESMAEAAFEMEVLASIRGSGEMPTVSAQSTSSAEGIDRFEAAESAPLSPPEARPAAQAAPISPSAVMSTSDDPQWERADFVAAGVVSQLRHAGMLNDLDGYMKLNGNPYGAAVLRMKDGRRALLVPYHETEAFTRRNLRRYDLLIFVGRDGKAVVVNSLENVIAERVSSRF